MDIVNDPLFSTLQQLMDIADTDIEKAFNAPTRAYVRDRKAMASTPADIKELPNSLVFVVDMPGVRPGEIKVQVEDDNKLVVSGERKRGEEKEAKYLLMERREGKFMRRFVLPENANVESGITAEFKDGVLTVTVQKKAPPEPKKIEVKVA